MLQPPLPFCPPPFFWSSWVGTREGLLAPENAEGGGRRRGGKRERDRERERETERARQREGILGPENAFFYPFTPLAYASSLGPHTLVAERPHTLVAKGLIQ
jgi:hypothetical protein